MLLNRFQNPVPFATAALCALSLSVAPAGLAQEAYVPPVATSESGAGLPGDAMALPAADEAAQPEVGGDGIPAASEPAGSALDDTARTGQPAAVPADGPETVTDANAAPEADAAQAPPASEQIAAPVAAPTPDPFPSPLADPRGALRWLLTQTDAGGHDLSPVGMYRGADIVVKLVMLGLAFASLVTWTVWLAKTLELWMARARARRALKVLARSASMREAQSHLAATHGPVGRMLAEARDEVAQSEPALDHAGGAGLKERVAAGLARIEVQSGRRMARGTGVLATIGSTAPFVGLFGTVWGIMNSFISIAESNTTNLAVVAPGIAEALLATAIGLVAAIPAVVIYNLFARSIAGYRLILGDACERIERLVSRDVDRRVIPAPVQAAA